MPPKPLRGPTRKSATNLPKTQQAKFLFETAVPLVDKSPQLSAVLGRRCLQVACGQHGALSRREAASMCGKCGCPLPAITAETATAIELPRAASRRRCRKALKTKLAKSQPAQVHRAAVVVACKLCNHKTLKTYNTLKAASEAVSKG